MATKTTVILLLALFIGWPLAALFVPGGFVPLVALVAWALTKRIQPEIEQSGTSALHARRGVAALEQFVNTTKGN